MASHTPEEVAAIQRCDALLILSKALDETKGITNSHMRARAMVQIIEGLRPIDKLSLSALVTSPRVTPATSPTVATKAGEDGRSAIGESNSESRPT